MNRYNFYTWRSNNMALKARNSAHKQQIEAGTKGRKRGHKFEKIYTFYYTNNSIRFNNDFNNFDNFRF